MNDAEPKFWVVLGFAGGFFAAVFLFSVALATLGWEVLKEWQTLIAGLIAAVLAIATIATIFRQISLTQEHEDDRRERKQYADRAAMPTALASLKKYGRANLKILVSLRAGLTPSGNIRFPDGWIPPEAPPFPSDAAETIRACLESTDKEKRHPLAQMLRDLQKLNSRLEGILAEVSDGSIMSVDMQYLSDYIVGAVDFITRCDTTIPYARGDEIQPPVKPTLDDMSSKAFFEDVYEEDFPYVYEAINRRYSAQ